MSDIDPIAMLQAAATRVRDPLSGRSVWLADMVRHSRVRDGALHLDLVFQAAHSPADRASIAEAIEKNIRGLGFTGAFKALHAGDLPGKPKAQHHHDHGHAPAAKPKADPVPGMSGPGMAPHGGPIEKKSLEGVKHIIAVASGKGGVGKSTVSTNLAVGLVKLGYSVGLMDADIYGPSLPVMMNTDKRPMVDSVRKRIIPVLAHGVKCMSMGLLVEPDQAMIWRGPMVMGAVRQFLQESDWDGIDYLIIDLPPGTGDAQLTLIQAVTLSGAVIVTTPQEVALADAVRGIHMFNKLDVPLLGLVENMAWYTLPDGSRDYVFGEDGGKRTAKRFDTDLLAQIPLGTAIRESGDEGMPAVLGGGETAEIFLSLARQVAAKLPLSAG